MKIFLSWSGDKSKAVALALRSWIPDIIQAVEPWMSEVDIEAGARWSREMNAQLEQTKFGIICLTKENQLAPWIHFEAGALAKTISDRSVCPNLIDLGPTEIRQGPLTQFQSKRANEKETWELIQAINKALKDDALSEEQLKRAFDMWFQNLKLKLDGLPQEYPGKKQDISIDEMVEEILGLVRGIARREASQQRNVLLDETIQRAIQFVRNRPDVSSKLEMDAEARHKFTVAVERLITQEMLAVFSLAARARENHIANSNEDTAPLTDYLIEVVKERIRRGEIHAKMVPEW
jgi:hypothetical protein